MVTTDFSLSIFIDGNRRCFQRSESLVTCLSDWSLDVFAHVCLSAVLLGIQEYSALQITGISKLDFEFSKTMGSCRVFIGHLSPRAREDDVERFFEGYGRVRDINLKNGYGFVEFDDERDADDAVHDLDNRELCGQRVKIEHAKGNPRGSYESRGYRGGGYGGGSSRGSGSYGYGGDRKRPSYFNSRAFDKYGPPTRTEYRVLVENLSTRVSWQDLKDYLRQAGEVTYADAHRERKNQGVVEFASYKDMKNAISKLDDTEINGRRIRLVEYRWRDSRSRSRSRRSRTRSRSPRRSRSRSSRRSRSDSGSRGRSRSPSKPRSRSRSRTPDRNNKRSRTPERASSRSRSRSASYEHANGGD